MKRLILALSALTIPFIASVSPAEATKLPCPQYHALMKKHGLPIREMSWIMARESNCQRKAVGWNYHRGKSHLDCKSGAFHKHRQCAAVRSWDMGLFQINSQTWDDLTLQLCGASVKSRTLLDASCNVKVAGAIYERYGLTPWKGNSNG